MKWQPEIVAPEEGVTAEPSELFFVVKVRGKTPEIWTRRPSDPEIGAQLAAADAELMKECTTQEEAEEVIRSAAEAAVRSPRQ